MIQTLFFGMKSQPQKTHLVISVNQSTSFLSIYQKKVETLKAK